MIASNFRLHPNALRFQREMFFIGHRNAPRLMRLFQVVVDWRPSVPAWAKKAAARAAKFARAAAAAQMELF